MQPLLSTSATGDGGELRTSPFSLRASLAPTALYRARRYVDLMSSPRLLDDNEESPRAETSGSPSASARAATTAATPGAPAKSRSGRGARAALADPELEETLDVMRELRRAASAHATTQQEQLLQQQQQEQQNDELAEASATTAATTGSSRGGTVLLTPRGPLANAFSPLRALREAFGDTRGSVLHRVWLETPQRHLSAVAEQLQEAVLLHYVRRFWPVTSSEGYDSASADDVAAYKRAFDVHVQWQPSKAGATGPAVVGHGSEEVVAVVIIRRRDALRRLAAEEARMAARYLAVAAEGQTVESSLRFWSDVSYVDRPRGEEAAFAPVGFDSASQVALEQIAADSTAESLDGTGEADAIGRGPAAGRKRVRETVTGGAGVGGLAPAVVLGAVGTSGKETAHPRAQPTHWRQPAPLLVAQEMRGTTLTTASANTATQRVRHSRVGLVAVLYVTLQAVAYVGFIEEAPRPTPAELKAKPEETTPPRALNAASTPAPSTLPSVRRPAVPVVMTQALLPLESGDSFTRGLLRL